MPMKPADALRCTAWPPARTPFIPGSEAAGVVTALASGWLLRTRRYRLARLASILQVACLVAGWGLAQYPYLIYPDLTIHQAAAPAPMLRFVLFTLPLGLALLLPSLWLLFRVFKGRVV